EKVYFIFAVLKTVYVVGGSHSSRVSGVIGYYLSELGAVGIVKIFNCVFIFKNYLFRQIQMIIHYFFNLFISVFNEVAVGIVFKIIVSIAVNAFLIAVIKAFRKIC